jgi:hypothetical protein
LGGAGAQSTQVISSFSRRVPLEAARGIRRLDPVVERAATVHGIDHERGRALVERRQHRRREAREAAPDDEP